MMLRSSPPVTFVIIAVITVLLFASFYHVNYGQLPESIAKYTTKAITKPSFFELATKYGTDKVITHSYHQMYQKYLEPIRAKKIRMLEIGLGCNMGYGPGASYYLWLEFFPHVELYFIEYDAACVEKWKDKIPGATVFTGDQEDIPFLKDFISKSGGNFDVIIDDGRHTMNQQLVSFDTLFSSVKPGGIYFCEDLQTSYWESYGGGPDNMKGTMMDRVRQNLNDLMEKQTRLPNMADVWSIDCMAEVCAFSKKELGQKY